MKFNKKGGWYGNSQGHALAAKGVRMYAKKQTLMDPLFYASKREEQVPFTTISDMTRQGMTFQEMRQHYPDADAEDLRRRGIRAIEMREGNGTLSTLNSNSVELSVKMCASSPRLRKEMLETLHDRQKSSFIHPVKVESLKAELGVRK